jgi:hypothetical protein
MGEACRNVIGSAHGRLPAEIVLADDLSFMKKGCALEKVLHFTDIARPWIVA